MTGSEWITLGSLFVAALSVASSVILEGWRARQATSLKRYEVTFLEKRKAFAELFGAFRALFYAAKAQGPHPQLGDAFGAEVNALHGLMPFLPKSDHPWLIERANEIERLAQEIWRIGSPT